VQEALIRVRRGLERYEPGSLEGWLARIVTNVFLDEMRRRKRRPADALPDDPGRVLPPTPAADEASQELSYEVQAALASIPEEFRTPVVLCDVADQSYEAIASTLSVPVGTVRSRIHRGRRLLRAALAEDGAR
jgi:RNA polymerase sigma-70 factor, ECF subfamily